MVALPYAALVGFLRPVSTTPPAVAWCTTVYWPPAPLLARLLLADEPVLSGVDYPTKEPMIGTPFCVCC